MNIEIDFTRPPQSYWMASTTTTNYPSLNEDLKVDLAIVGGGIAGVLCAYFLGKEGIKIAIIEADRILQGTTGHTTAKITSQHGLIYSKLKTTLGQEIAKQYADANEEAIKMFKKIADENKIECDLKEQSSYIFTLRDGYVDKILDETDTAVSLGLNAAYLEETPLPFKVKAAIRFDNQAQFHPRKFLLALAGKITEAGGLIFEQSRVVNIDEAGKYVLTAKNGKKVTAEKVIIASHYPVLNKAGMYFSRIYPERSYVIAIKAKDAFPGGMYINAEEPARSLRSLPTENGELIIIGGEHHKTGQGEDTINHYNALVDFANKYFTVEDISYRWSTQDCMTMDSLPFTGRFTSDTPDMFITTGYGKWGMTNSMASAMILRDLIIKGESPWQDAYNPSRVTVAASAKSFVVENLNVAKNLIKGKIQDLPENIEIKKGEGKIIEADGQRAGAYRDENGKLHIVNTTCTHMGCELNWNSAEKSWDCPCHGSRFTYEGDIIEGPAVEPLDMGKDVNTIKKLINEKF